MDRFRVVFLIVILTIVLFGPDGSSPAQSRHADELLAHERLQLNVLRNSSWTQPGNATGLFVDGPTPPEVVRQRWQTAREHALGVFARLAAGSGVPLVAESSRQLLQKSNTQRRAVEVPGVPEMPFYRNATGSLHGDWARLDVGELPTTALANATYDRNFTASAGKMTLSIGDAAEHDRRVGDAAEVGAVVRLKDEQGGSEMSLAMHGVHFAGSGEMVLTTTSERFAGLFALPHFTSTEAAYTQSKELLLKTIEESMKEHATDETAELPWRSSADGALALTNPKCEYIMYLQLHLVGGAQFPPSVDDTLRKGDNELPWLIESGYMTPGLLRRIEHDLRFPSGAPLPPVPPLVATAMIYSPTCGIVLQADDLEGHKVEQFYNQTKNFGLVTAAITAVQTWLLIRQMNETNTPSTVSRVSFWTVALMSVVDGYFLFTFMIVALFLHACFLPLIAASFGFFVLLTMFEMRFLVNAYRVQRPERRVAAPAAPPAPTPAPTPADGLPLPVTATPQVPTTVLPPAAPGTTTTTTTDADDDIRSEIGTLHTRFYFALLATLFLTVHAASWPPFFRNIFLHALLLLTNSYWVPQLYRNSYRGCRKAFRWEFVFGTSVCRILGALYLYLYPHNLFRLEPNPTAAAVVAGWVWIQCAALLSQEMFGPRFLIPPGWLPPVYDYHSAMPLDDDDDVEARGGDDAGSGGSSGSHGRGRSRGSGRGRSFDCAICLRSVEVPARDDAGSTGGSGAGRSVGLLGRRNYMVTPCRHVFHSICLEGWMRLQLKCPICRNSLPPL